MVDETHVRWPRTKSFPDYRRHLLSGKEVPDSCPEYYFRPMCYTDKLGDAIDFENQLVEESSAASTSETEKQTYFSRHHSTRKRVPVEFSSDEGPQAMRRNLKPVTLDLPPSPPPILERPGGMQSSPHLSSQSTLSARARTPVLVASSSSGSSTSATQMNFAPHLRQLLLNEEKILLSLDSLTKTVEKLSASTESLSNTIGASCSQGMPQPITHVNTVDEFHHLQDALGTPEAFNKMILRPPTPASLRSMTMCFAGLLQTRAKYTFFECK